MRASILIVSHRPHDWLSASIESAIRECDDVIVVDNGSGGAVEDLARASGARVLSLPDNLGFPAAVNLGADLATGDVLALLNDDAMAQPGWIESASSALENPTVGSVTPKLVFARPYAEIRFDDETHFAPGDPRRLGRALRSVTVRGVEVLDRLLGPGVHRLETGVLDGTAGRWRWTTGRDPMFVPLQEASDAHHLHVDGAAFPSTAVVEIINSAGTYLSAHGYGGDFGYGSPDDGSFDEPAERFGGCGAALVTRTETWRRLGGFAANFFAYYEDLDWSWRVRLHGLENRYEPAGVVRHVGGATTGGPVDERVRRLAGRNRLLCLARNAPLRILAAEARRRGPDEPGGSTLARHVPVALVERVSLRRSWRLSPHDVWERWAGADERWPCSAPS